MEESFNHLAKIVMIGESGVGKTSIVRCLSDKQFIDNHVATIGIDFVQRQIRTSHGVVKMTIWDTAGQERFHSLNQSAYNGELISC